MSQNASVYHSGFLATATLDGTSELAVEQWDANLTADLTTFKNSRTGQIPWREATYSDANGTLTCDLDFASGALGIGTFKPGSILTGMKLFLHQATRASGPGVNDAGSMDGPYITLTRAIIEGTPVAVNTDGKPQVRFNWRAAGGQITISGLS